MTAQTPEQRCECDQICCTWCDIHGDTGVDIDAIARDHERGSGITVEIVVPR